MLVHGFQLSESDEPPPRPFRFRGDASVSDILARSEEEDGGLQIQTFPKQHMATIAVKNTGAAYAAAAPAPRPAQPKAEGKNKQPPAGMRLAAAIKTVKGAMDKIQLFHVI